MLISTRVCYISPCEKLPIEMLLFYGKYIRRNPYCLNLLIIKKVKTRVLENPLYSLKKPTKGHTGVILVKLAKTGQRLYCPDLTYTVAV
jgi:hypothetical protein